VVRKHPLIAFFVLAYLLTWWIYPLLKVSPLLGIFGLFGPALAAIIVAALTEGKAGVKALLSRAVHWRVGLPWYVVALGLPTLLSLVTAGLYYLLGGSEFIKVGPLSIFDLVLFVLVVGEELGWRGYALPQLLKKRSALTASLILGVLWGLWHLPTFLVPGTPQYGLPLAAFVLLTVEYSILMTWLYLHTSGSVLLATLFHGAINVSQGVFLGAVSGATRYWLLCIVYGIAAAVAALVLARKSLRESTRASTHHVSEDSTTS
jgi:membrane protease YdiL (CAAX protease family)